MVGIEISVAPPFGRIGIYRGRRSIRALNKRIKSYYTVYWHKRGRDCIKQAVDIIQVNEGRKLRVLLPDYICKEVVQAIRRRGVEMRYYDGEDVGGLARSENKNSYDVIFIVDYFGRGVDRSAVKRLRKEFKGWLIGDLCHSVQIQAKDSDYDFTIFSLWKHLPVQSGALLLWKKGRRGVDIEGSEHGYSRCWIDIDDLIWVFKRMCGWLRLYRKDVRHKDAKQDAEYVARRLSRLSVAMTMGVSGELGRARLAKRKAAVNWRRLGDSLGIDLRADSREYFVEIDLSKNNSHKVDMLINSGVPFRFWPEFDEEVSKAGRLMELEKRRRSALYLPLNGSLDERSIKRITKRFARQLSDSYSFTSISRTQYQQLSLEAEYIPLVQSGDYNKSFSNQAVVFLEGRQSDGRRIAICAVRIRKTILGKIGIINCGPVSLERNRLSEIEREAVMTAIDLYLKKQGHCAVLVYTAQSKRTLGRGPGMVGWSRKTTKFDTGIIRLKGRGPEEIRRDLQGKWRNQLKKAEKNGLSATISEEYRHIHDIALRNKNFARQRGFTAIDPGFMEKWFNQTEESGNGRLVCITIRIGNDSRVCSMLVYIEGRTATNLMLVNTDKGRRLCAANLAMWKALMHAKEMGAWTFDVGGLSSKTIDGVAHFKKGLRPERVQYYGVSCVL